jgi:hypothetical protein
MLAQLDALRCKLKCDFVPLGLSAFSGLRREQIIRVRLARSFTHSSVRVCRQTDSLEIPTLDQGEEIRSTASDQDGGLDLDAHLHVLSLGSHSEIADVASAPHRQQAGIWDGSPISSRLPSGVPSRVIVQIRKSLAGPIYESGRRSARGLKSSYP